MIISTNCGNFGNFKDVHTFMTLEHLEIIQIYFVSYWGTKLPSAGLYTRKEIRALYDSNSQH